MFEGLGKVEFVAKTQRPRDRAIGQVAFAHEALGALDQGAPSVGGGASTRKRRELLPEIFVTESAGFSDRLEVVRGFARCGQKIGGPS